MQLDMNFNSKKMLTDSVIDKESELFAMLFLLDNQDYVYYDDENDEDISMLENHLKMNNIPFVKGQRNRKYLSTLL